MKRFSFSGFSNQRGATIISTLIAAAIIVTSIGAVSIPAMQLHKAMKKSELANLVVIIESNLISAFHNKINFDNATPAGLALNTSLRAGTIPPTVPLSVSFDGGTPLVLTRNVAGDEASVVGYLQRDLASCTAYSHSCVLRYEIRLKRMSGAPVPAYSFAYQLDANPDVMIMAPLGDITSYTSPVDAGLYRAEAVKTNCDPVTDLFMNGINRDTGEAYCVTRPTDADKCADDHLPKGLVYTAYTSNPKAGVLKVKCTSLPMRRFTCPPNYALQEFAAPWVDPVNTSYPTVPGTCVFRSAQTATQPNTVPANPTAPYARSASATICPPYYRVSAPTGCTLEPNAARNAAPEGMGLCASTGYKNCSRTTSTTVSDGGAAYTAYLACLASPPALPATCGTAPANPVYSYSCYNSQTSADCDGNVTSGGPNCAVVGSWSGGTPYAYNFAPVPPSASAQPTVTGRRVSCTFTDTSPNCNAPNLDYNGNTWGKNNPKWFGGVKIQGTGCELDPTLIAPPGTVTAGEG